MKKFNLSLIASLTLSTFAIAGGDIAPVEPMVETPEVEVTNSGDTGFYVGGGYSYMRTLSEGSASEAGQTVPLDLKATGHGFNLLAGYIFHKYVALESRYTRSVSDFTLEANGQDDQDLEDYTMSNIGIYLKPMYPIDGGLTVYGLLGYGETTIDTQNAEASESGFQWGAGASYAINDNISLFADYTRLYYEEDAKSNINDILITTDDIIDSVNVGLTYKF